MKLMLTVISALAILSLRAQTPFTCENKLYLSNGTILYEYSPISGNQTALFPVGNVNALAFSTTGLMWAFNQTPGSKSVVIIGEDGVVTPISIPGLPISGSFDYNVGAIDTHGYYYLYDGQQGGRFYIIDTDPARTLTYGKLVDPTATGGVIPYALDTRSTVGTPIYPLPPNHDNRRIISDWCINPADGQLYTVTNSGSYRPNRLISYDPVTGQITEHTGQISGGGTGTGFQGNASYGAIFIDLAGNYFVFGNTHGHLYSIDISTSTATKLSSNSISSSNIDGANCISSTIPMPVHFGTVAAKLVNDRVEVEWTTLTETNNDHFEIEASSNGTTFTKMGAVKSKALDGNSDITLSYSFSKNASEAAGIMGISALTLALGLGVARRGRRKVVVQLLAITGVLLVSFSACSKNDAPVEAKEGKLFIRIKQVDKDGSFEYSKVVEVVKE